MQSGVREQQRYRVSLTYSRIVTLGGDSALSIGEPAHTCRLADHSSVSHQESLHEPKVAKHAE